MNSFSNDANSETTGIATGFLSARADSYDSAPLVLPAGTRLVNDRFVIDLQVGLGVSGPVYKAHDVILDTDVALKILSGVDPRSQAMEQLLQDLQIRRTLTKVQAIIRVHDLHQDTYDGQELTILAMEYADGGNFRSWLESSRRDKENRRSDGLTIFRAICLTVKDIHSEGCVHLDLKPENFVFTGGEIKITDFGCARNLADLSLNRSAIMRPGLGTVAYMSPDRIFATREKDIGIQAEIYNLGCIAYELLDGDPPFDGDDDEVKRKHLEKKPSNIEGIDESLFAIIARCLEKDPSARYQKVEDLIEALDHCATDGDYREQPIVTQLGRTWHCLNPHFKSLLASKVSQSAAIIEGKVVDGISGADLVDSGCADRAEMRGGRLLAGASLLALAAGSRFDHIRRYYGAISGPSPRTDPAYLLCCEGNEAKARSVMAQRQNTEFELADTLLYSAVFGDDAATRGTLERVLQMNSTMRIHGQQYFDLGRVAAMIGLEPFLQDYRRYYESNEAYILAARRSHEHVDVLLEYAKGWRDIFHDEDGARRCIEGAENHARLSNDWRMCALAWMSCLGDRGQTVRCIEKAETLIENNTVSRLSNRQSHIDDWECILGSVFPRNHYRGKALPYERERQLPFEAGFSD